MVCRVWRSMAWLAALGAARVAEPAERMFASLPAVFRNRDETRDLTRLLDVLAAFFFTGRTIDDRFLPGLEQRLDEIPALFSPMGAPQDELQISRTPNRFLDWLATWLSFTPHALFGPEALRRIVGGIVPLYGLRGTRDYLERLLKLCFVDEAAEIHVDDRPSIGFTVGQSAIGVDTRLALSRPFCFKVVIERHEAETEPMASDEVEALHHRMRAVIDFAKPAHTTYELEWRTRPRDTRSREHPVVSSRRGG
jgi:phage tail-like protein